MWFVSGKYKGHTVEEICRTDPNYIAWLLVKETEAPMPWQIYDAIKEHFDQTILLFGKYKGRSIGDVASVDKGYLQWLKGSDIIRRYAYLKTEIDKYI